MAHTLGSVAVHAPNSEAVTICFQAHLFVDCAALCYPEFNTYFHAPFAFFCKFVSFSLAVGVFYKAFSSLPAASCEGILCLIVFASGRSPDTTPDVLIIPPTLLTSFGRGDLTHEHAA